jgi:hypothetical protein
MFILFACTAIVSALPRAQTLFVILYTLPIAVRLYTLRSSRQSNSNNEHSTNIL